MRSGSILRPSICFEQGTSSNDIIFNGAGDLLFLCPMTRIGVLSDTHGWLDDAVFRHFEECNEIWHAGDIGNVAVAEQLVQFKPFKAVYGNIDDHVVRAQYPKDQRFTCEDVKVWITHIGGRPGHYAQGIRAELIKNVPDLFICGHSHLCLVQMDKQFNMLHMNPGAAGRHGFHKVRTLIRFTIDGSKMRDAQVIELGPRSAGENS